jgi:nucleoside-diphosphate-sugar epimerase
MSAIRNRWTRIVLATLTFSLYAAWQELFLRITALVTEAPICSVVTGANGFVGRAIVLELMKRGSNQDILCLVREHRVRDEEVFWSQLSQVDQPKCIRVLPYDMLDGGESLHHALATTDSYHQRIVFHVASVFGPTQDHQKTALDNVQGTVDVVNVLSRVGNCKLVLTSSTANDQEMGSTMQQKIGIR